MKTPLLVSLMLCAAGALAQPAGQTQDYRSARIIQTIEPAFPDELIALYRRGGDARILISIDSEGRLNDWLVTGYSARGFADSALAAVKRWEFEAARFQGEPVSVCIELNFHFEVKGVVVSLTASELIQANFNELSSGDAYAPCTLRDIDRIPVPLNPVKPAYPRALAAQGVAGEVTVDFYIDEAGKVRMPYVTGRPHPALANIAADTVRQWTFEPPTRKGIPVLVHARQLFRFSPASATTN